MCGPTDIAPSVGYKLEKDSSMTTTTTTTTTATSAATTKTSDDDMSEDRPLDVVLEPPSLISRYICASVMIAIFAVWGRCSFPDENQAPGIGSDIHSWQTPLLLTTGYLISLPLLRCFSKYFLSQVVDVKLLLKETMIVYNGGQVLLNAWMVYRFVDALINHGHPFIGDLYTNKSGTTFAVWIHYMDKYLEFFDTFFMVLRGRMDQVSRN
jgi:elongation of very long chain fatty acids protein 4